MKFFLLLICFSLFSDRIAVYHSLDQTSISELFAFYQLYPESEEGKASLHKVWDLLNKHRKTTETSDSFVLPELDIHSIINLVNRKPMESPSHLSPENLRHLSHLTSHLGNRKLKGYHIWTEKETRALPNEEIDLARALLLAQYKDDRLKIEQYEATLDVMAIQILARLQPGATEREKVHAINHFIFHEMAFRFPPQSLFAKEIDYYTMLPSVIDNRKGVCLGVSILYLCLAERLDLPLTIITPPGHIFLRHKELTIETTARGIHVPNERYLGVNTRSLPERTMKEVVGMAFVNQASIALQNHEYQIAADLYEKAEPYMPEDDLLKMLLGITYVITGKTDEGKNLFTQIAGKIDDHAVSADSLPLDYLAGNIDAEGIALAFESVDEGREAIIKKQKELSEKLKTYPKFRAGLLHLATTYMQLARHGEALEILNKYHAIDSADPTVEYYLAALSLERFDFKKAWNHYQNAYKTTAARNHAPQALKSLHRQLKLTYPQNIK